MRDEWFTVLRPYGEAMVYGPFKTKREAVFEAQFWQDTAAKPTRKRAGEYELGNAIITTDVSDWEDEEE